MTIQLRSLGLEFDEDQGLRVLDQRHLPDEERWETVRSPRHLVELIVGLAIRGAPLIGVSAALGLAWFARGRGADAERIRAIAQQLKDARPTAVNLAWAIQRMLAENPRCQRDGLMRTAAAIFAEDVAMCEAMADHGSRLIADGDGILTICNTGGLATVGIGTALGVIRRAHEQGKRIHVYACETRPLLQGARLTAWELGRLGIPHTLICDGMAATLLRSGAVRSCFVGADRIAANGDFANKIGTCSLAVLARHHGIPFYTVAPTSTVDTSCPTGAQIPIEQRPADEVRGASGAFGRVRWAPEDSPTWNPAFDVTPAELLTGIVLDTGVRTELSAPPHDARSVRSLLAGSDDLRARLGGEPESWQVGEIGDGNVNLVFRIRGSSGSLLLKQAVPYLRCVGAAWPLSVERVGFEYRAFLAHRALAPSFMPEIHHYDRASASLVMEWLGTQRVMRKGMIEGMRYPRFAEHIADYMASTLWGTSDWALPAPEKKRRVADFAGNTDLCGVTEDLIFTDPYRACERNRWTAPQLDGIAADIRADSDLAVAITGLKRRFLGATEALIHGDLHTGSIMIDATSTKVIDPEFAVYGPIGFDPGLLLGNLLLSYFSQAGHATAVDDRHAYEAWILEQVEEVWSGFAKRFALRCRDGARGDLVPERLLVGRDGRALVAVIDGELRRILSEAIGFAGAEMIRRILGLAHVEDLGAISDAHRRAACELRALRLARWMLVERDSIGAIEALTSRAAAIRAESGRSRARKGAHAH
jgi:5-methylthioribose kinase